MALRWWHIRVVCIRTGGAATTRLGQQPLQSLDHHALGYGTMLPAFVLHQARRHAMLLFLGGEFVPPAFLRRNRQCRQRVTCVPKAVKDHGIRQALNKGVHSRLDLVDGPAHASFGYLDLQLPHL